MIKPRTNPFSPGFPIISHLSHRLWLRLLWMRTAVKTCVIKAGF